MSAGNGAILGHWQPGQWVSYLLSVVEREEHTSKCDLEKREEGSDRQSGSSVPFWKRLVC